MTYLAQQVLLSSVGSVAGYFTMFKIQDKSLLVQDVSESYMREHKYKV